MGHGSSPHENSASRCSRGFFPRITIAAIVIGGILAVWGPRPYFVVAAGTTVWDGVYTTDQANHGEQLYSTRCTGCHGPGLEGSDMAPGLADDAFKNNWDNRALIDLFDVVSITMPKDAPGALASKQNADVMAFLLSKNGFPEGKTELPTTDEQLAAIKFLKRRP